MLRTVRKACFGAGVLVLLLGAGVSRAEAQYPVCSQTCTPSSDCGEQCVTDEGSPSSCGNYGVCNPGCNPNWQYSQQVVGGFQVTYWASTPYCVHYGTIKVNAHDTNGCEADYSFCTYQENGTRYWPEHESCCFYWWCGGSGPNCPA